MSFRFEYDIFSKSNCRNRLLKTITWLRWEGSIVGVGENFYDCQYSKIKNSNSAKKNRQLSHGFIKSNVF